MAAAMDQSTGHSMESQKERLKASHLMDLQMAQGRGMTKDLSKARTMASGWDNLMVQLLVRWMVLLLGL